MVTERAARRLGAWVICLSIGLRLVTLWAQPMMELLKNGQMQAFLLYLETGRKVRFSPSLEETAEFVAESPPPVSTPAAEILPVFSITDAQQVEITNKSGMSPSLEGLMTQPLSWDLKNGAPAVLILHSHTTESYTKSGETYTETAAYRTLAEEYNMLSIGDHVSRILSENGITVIHDRELHDYPSYNSAYVNARDAIEFYLERYPTIQLVLDLHRDAAGEGSRQLRTLAQIGGRDSAQLMIVVGTGASAGNHPNWQTNLSLALKLQVQLERLAPGITRPINLRSQRFNQDLSPGALLVEVGAAGNSHAEALRAAEILAQAVTELAKGAAVE